MKLNVMVVALLLAAVVGMAGCALTPPILKASESKSFFEDAVYSGETTIISKDLTSEEQYRAFVQGASSFVPVSLCKEEAEQKAGHFCEGMNKKVKVVQETVSMPPHILGNFPRAEIVFVCIEKPAIKPSDDELYIKISNLKKLLDNGALTKEEYEQQKAIVLKK